MSRRPSLSRAVRDRRVWRRSARLGLSVGLLQAVLNQGDHWLNPPVDALVVGKTLLCPLLSFSIAFVSAASTYAESSERSDASLS